MQRPKSNIFFYDAGDDSLTFIRKDCAARHTIDAGLVLVSLDARNAVVALEFMGARKNFGISKKVLEGLRQARVTLRKEKDSLIIAVSLRCDEKEYRIVSTSTVREALGASTFKATVCA